MRSPEFRKMMGRGRVAVSSPVLYTKNYEKKCSLLFDE